MHVELKSQFKIITPSILKIEFIKKRHCSETIWIVLVKDRTGKSSNWSKIVLVKNHTGQRSNSKVFQDRQSLWFKDCQDLGSFWFCYGQIYDRFGLGLVRRSMWSKGYRYTIISMVENRFGQRSSLFGRPHPSLGSYWSSIFEVSHCLNLTSS